MKPLAIIQARMSSNRLPGKVLMEVGGGKLIDRIIDSARQSKNVKKIYVATSTHKSDDPLVEYLDDKEVSIYRGSLDNVFARYQKISLIEEKQQLINKMGKIEETYSSLTKPTSKKIISRIESLLN